MDFHAVQHFYKARIAVVYDFAVTQIQLGDFPHILIAEGEIPEDVYKRQG